MCLPVHIPTDHLAKFCHQHHIKRLSLFGSVLSEGFRPTSDIVGLPFSAGGEDLGLEILHAGYEFSVDDRLGFLSVEQVQLAPVDRIQACDLDGEMSFGLFVGQDDQPIIIASLDTGSAPSWRRSSARSSGLLNKYI